MFSAISTHRHTDPPGMGGRVHGLDLAIFFTAVPLLLVCLGGRPVPTTRQVSSGDRHLKFHETRDNLKTGFAGQEVRLSRTRRPRKYRPQ